MIIFRIELNISAGLLAPSCMESMGTFDMVVV